MRGVKAKTIGCAAALLLTTSAAPPPMADLIVTHAQVKTMDSAHPAAEAIAVRAGKIMAIGTTAEIETTRGPATQMIDAGGKTLLPGFIDTHMHPQPAFDEMSLYGRLQLSADAGVTSRAALFAKITAKAKRLPAGALVVGAGYGDDIVGGHPTARELDAVVHDHPVILYHSSGHRLVANSLALKLAGVTATTPDPAGGSYARDPDGTATGIVLETAMQPFDALIARSPIAQPPRAALLEAYRDEFRGFVAFGLTGVADAAATPDKIGIYRDLLTTGLPVSIYAMLLSDHLDWLIANRAKPEWQVPGLTLRTVKVFAGNSFSGKTAWLWQPYADRPDYYGLPPKLRNAALTALLRRAHAAGLQIAVHANGDREIDELLDAYATIEREAPRANARHRIEHASVVTDAIIARIKALNLCVAPHSYLLNHGGKLDGFGAARFEWIEPNRRALDAGICVGGTSDHPVSPPHVMQRIQSLVTRRAASNGRVYGPGQRLSAEAALRTFTMGSAYLQFEEAERGSITPGKRADFVLLSADPAATDPERIGAIRVERTIIAGKTVYDASGAKPRFSF